MKNTTLYDILERADVIDNETVLVVTSRESIRKDLELMRNSGFDVDIYEKDRKTEARIKFKNSRQMARFATKLKVHKLWDQRAIDFVHAVRRGVESGAA